MVAELLSKCGRLQLEVLLFENNYAVHTAISGPKKICCSHNTMMEGFAAMTSAPSRALDAVRVYMLDMLQVGFELTVNVGKLQRASM